MAKGRLITLKNDKDEWLIPKTMASNVVALIYKKEDGSTEFVYQESVNSTLAQETQKIIDGVIPVGIANYLYFKNPDDGKDDKIGYGGLMDKVDDAAKAAAGTNWETVGKVYVDNEITKVKNGDVVIPEASEQNSGAVKLATVADVEKQNDSLDNASDSPKAVTPNTLWRYLQSIKGAVNGVASLDSDGKVPASQLPSYGDDVLEFTNKDSFPRPGEGSKIYVDLATGKTYRWSGSTYTEISASLAIGNITGTAYDGALGAANAAAISNILEGTTTVPKAVSAKATKVSKSSEADPNFALSFYAGTAEASTTPTADKVYVGSRVDPNIISVPALDGSASMANYMNLRMSFNSRYFHEIAALPNYYGIYHRMVYNGNALEWKQLAYKSDVNEVRQDVDNIEIDTRNLIPNSTKIGGVSSSSDNYSFVTITLPTDVGAKIGDVFTFNCDKVENVHGNPTKYSIRLYNKKTGAVASKDQQITAENRVLPLEALIDVEQGELALLVYIGESGSTVGNEVYFYDCTLVKGNKPMLLWQPALEDEVAWRKIVGLNYVVTGEPIEY